MKYILDLKHEGKISFFPTLTANFRLKLKKSFQTQGLFLQTQDCLRKLKNPKTPYFAGCQKSVKNMPVKLLIEFYSVLESLKFTMQGWGPVKGAVSAQKALPGVETDLCW